MKKRIALVILVFSFAASYGQVSEDFNGGSLCSGFLKCWNHYYQNIINITQFAPNYNSICNDPGNLSLNTSTPINGTGSLRLNYSTSLEFGGSGTHYSDTLNTIAYGSDGNSVSIKLKLTDFNLSADMERLGLEVTIICGDYKFSQPLLPSDVGNIININTTISGSNGGGVIKIVFYSAFWTLVGNSNASYIIDMDDFSTNAALDLNNSCVTTVLPVSFTDVKATLRRGSLLITWATAKETNNDHFRIEGSRNGKDFQELGRVSSKAINGNSAAALLYDFSFQLHPAASYANLTWIGLLLLSSLLMFFFKKKITGFKWFIIAAYGFTIGLACNKVIKQDGIINADKYFVRIVQVDKDAKESYSKIFQVIEEE